MIDVNLRISPAAFAAAEAGQTDQLRDELAPANLEPVVVDAVVDAVTDASVRLDVVDAGAGGATIRRAHVSPVLALLHANGDDRDTPNTVLTTQSGAELLHVLLAGLGFGFRPDHDPTPAAVTLDDPHDTLRAAIGEATLPDAIEVPDERPLRWWSIGSDLPDTGPLTVLDAGMLWRQRGPELVPTTALEVWDELTPLLHHLSRLQRPPHPDATATAPSPTTGSDR